MKYVYYNMLIIFREMEDWLVKKEGTWVLAESFNNFLGRVFNDEVCEADLFFLAWAYTKIIDLVKLVMCTLASRVHMTKLTGAKIIINYYINPLHVISKP